MLTWNLGTILEFAWRQNKTKETFVENVGRTILRIHTDF
jgi:hypothetical protein